MSITNVNQVQTTALLDPPAHPVEEASRPPTFISEREVAFGTAAAGTVPRTERHWWTTSVLRELLHSSHRQPARHHYPPRRADFMERAAMAREMRRL